MAVDVAEIKSLYSELNSSVKDVLDVQDAASTLTSEDYAAVLTKLLGANLEMAVKTVQNQPMLDAQIANLQKDADIKASQIALENQKIASMIIDDNIKQAQSTKDLAVKDSNIANNDSEIGLRTIQGTEAQANGTSSRELEAQKKTSMIADDGVKSAQSSKDLAVKDKQIANMGSEITSRGIKDSVMQNDSASKIAVNDAQRLLLITQEDEAGKNGIATRAVKAQDVVVKTNQASLLTRQKSALDDSLLKDILKEASGGYAMVYEAVSTPDIPGTWAYMDAITKELLKNAGVSETIVTSKTLTK